MTRTLGYTRELLAGDDTSADASALRRAGASKVYVDRRRSTRATRPELEKCLSALSSGDILLVSSAAMLSTTVEQFVIAVGQLRARGIHLRSLSEPALSTTSDTSLAPGDVLDALDALRRRLIGLRTREGLEAALAAGRKPGRPRVMTDDRIAVAKELRAQQRSFAQIGRALGVSEAAVRRALAPRVSSATDHISAE